MNPLDRLVDELRKHDVWQGSQLLKRNEYLVRPGQINNRVYFIESGSLRVFISDGADEQCIRFGYKGSVMAVLDTFITGQPSGMFIQAIKKTSLRWVSRPVYESFLHESQERSALWNEVLYQLVIQQLEREQDLLTSSPAERYRRVLARSPQLFREIPRKYIASYLRMTPETLSRIKSLDPDQGN